MSVPLPGLRPLREQSNLSRTDLARLAGISVSTVRVAEGVAGNGKRLALASCSNIADALGVGIETLLGETPFVAFRRRREEVTDYLLSYRAIYLPRGGAASRKTQRRAE